MTQNDPVMMMTEVKETVSDMVNPKHRRWIILFLLLVGLSAILLVPNPTAESTPNVDPRDSWAIQATIEAEVVGDENVKRWRFKQPDSVVPEAEVVAVPEDPYAKYEGQPVPHPRREPDLLVIGKISRYDPELGGTNCFRWGWDPAKGRESCLSSLSNGERWEVNYEIAVACDQSWPYYTVVEIGGKLWYCKDHGGKIVQSRPGVFWVDQLSTTGHYTHGYEMPMSVWFPQ